MRSLVLGTVIVVVASACGGGGGGGDEAALDLSGWWAWEQRFVPGDGIYRLASFSQAEHTGSSSTIGCVTFAVDGASLTATTPAPKGGTHDWALEILDPDRLEGTQTFVTSGGEADSVRELRLARTSAPAGSLRYAGRVLGEDRDEVSSTGYALYLDDWQLTSQWSLRLRDDRVGHCLVVEAVSTVDPATVTAPFTITVGVDGNARILVGPTDVRANAGTAVLTVWEAGRAAGTFDVTLDDGGTLAGSFDVSVVSR